MASTRIPLDSLQARNTFSFGQTHCRADGTRRKNGKAAAFTRNVFHFHTTVHFRYEPGRNRQSQAKPGNIACTIQPFKCPEYPFFLLRTYSHACIPDRDVEFSIRIFNLKAHLPVECELHVEQQVAGYLPDMRAVATDDSIQTGEGRGERQIFLPGDKTVAVRYFLKQDFQVEDRAFGVNSAFIYPVVFHQCVYQAKHVIGGVQDVVQIATSAVDIALCCGQQFCTAFDSGQQSAQVMGGRDHQLLT